MRTLRRHPLCPPKAEDSAATCKDFSCRKTFTAFNGLQLLSQATHRPLTRTCLLGSRTSRDEKR